MNLNHVPVLVALGRHLCLFLASQLAVTASLRGRSEIERPERSREDSDPCRRPLCRFDGHWAGEPILSDLNLLSQRLSACSQTCVTSSGARFRNLKF